MHMILITDDFLKRKYIIDIKAGVSEGEESFNLPLLTTFQTCIKIHNINCEYCSATQLILNRNTPCDLSE